MRYCLPTDTQRPLLDADTQFFNYSGTGKGEFSLLSLPRLTECGCKVPVIAIFTKFDGLVTTAFQNLRANGKTRQEAMADAPNTAQRMLTAEYIDQLKKMNFSPSEYVRLDDMREKTSTCIELLTKTANSLDENVRRLLLVSVQRNNLVLCIHYAVKQGLKRLTDSASARWFAETTLSCFPHIWRVSLTWNFRIVSFLL
ncbi:GTP-binding protein [Mycena venus]|uniref:GTP-binding protein n=1 Tax=Mycena venus TaxID=2733690 RepID=A0A8H7DBP6_9AGAR|nr:GTP-binding protein [Mycena venus]